jgi:integrase
VYGLRPRRTFEQAAAKYLLENTHKASILDDAMHLKQLMPHLGALSLEQVHADTLAPFIAARRAEGIRTKSINNALGVVRRILNLAARAWRDERGVTWLETAPLIAMAPVTDAAKPYPLDWEEQRRLLEALPAHLAQMALFKVNTGTREQEVCRLRWEWEVAVPELGTSVFIIPARDEHGTLVKNGEDRLVVLNTAARSVIEALRTRDGGQGPVFTYRGRRVTRMHNSAWKRAWRRAGLPVDPGWLRGVDNLKHTLGRRLRAAGVPLETRRVLLGHKNGDITSHYSVPEIRELLEATERVCVEHVHKMPTLALLKRRAVSEAVC